MANAWVGKASVTFVFVVPTQEGVEAVRTFLKAPLKLYGNQEAPTWASKVGSLLHIRRPRMGSW